MKKNQIKWLAILLILITIVFLWTPFVILTIQIAGTILLTIVILDLLFNGI